MRNEKIVLISSITVMAVILSMQVCADVNHHKATATQRVTYVSDDSWQPDNFDNGTAVPAAHMIDAGITVDGKTDEIQWKNAVEVTVPLFYGEVREVSVKALYTDEEVFLSVRWPDATQNRDHHPWTWDSEQQHYVEGPQIEDSVLLSFEAGCEWTPSLLSGYIYDFDAWHWLAARSDPLGQALDLYGNTQTRELYNTNFGTHQARNQVAQWQLKFTDNSVVDMNADWYELNRIYMKLPVTETISIRALPDGGPRSPPYFELLPPPANAPEDEGKTYPQFNPVKLSGDAGEVNARGHWENGYWTVEFRRDLETPVGHIYDTIFNRLVQFSVHVFDRTDQLNEVSESGRLFLQFMEPKLSLVKE
jgi:hypothetical protein